MPKIKNFLYSAVSRALWQYRYHTVPWWHLLCLYTLLVGPFNISLCLSLGTNLEHNPFNFFLNKNILKFQVAVIKLSIWCSLTETVRANLKFEIPWQLNAKVIVERNPLRVSSDRFTLNNQKYFSFLCWN